MSLREGLVRLPVVGFPRVSGDEPVTGERYPYPL